MAPVALTPAQQAFSGLLGLLLLGGALQVFVQLIRWLRAHGGQVRAAAFALPDLLMAIVLASAFGALVVKAVLTKTVEPAALEADQVLPSSFMFAIIVAGIAGFLRWRGVNLSALFGLRQQPLLRIAGWAALLLLAALPFISIVNLLILTWLKDPEQQPLVELFRTVAARSDYASVLKIGLAGVILAPVCEEFLFRGYFYAVGKRYAGPWVSGLLSAALFAAFHANLAALPGLFILAVFFTLAYERTGSLLVPMTMHALFNATSLGLLYLQATGRLPA